MLQQLREREQEIAACPLLPTSSGQFTAYVANFNRPQNIESIVHSLLASPSISHVIVSNNNPACTLSRWFVPSSDRVTVLSHETQQGCSMRYKHLQEFPSSFYLILDDDVFLLPSQIEQLCTSLIADPVIPHGLYGQRWEEDHFRGGIQNMNGEIDVISRIYAFTDTQMKEFFRMTTLLEKDESNFWEVSRYDDMFISFSGVGRPRIHDAGALIDCPTQGAKDIATWRKEGFHHGRIEMYQWLTRIKPRTI